MSLELAIKENTSAVEALIDVWTKLVAQGNTVTDRVAEKTAAGEDHTISAGGVTIATVKAPKPAAEKTAPAPTQTAPAAPPVKAAAPAPATESPSDETLNEVVDLALLTKETTGAATRNRAGLVALLGEFGAKRAGEIPEAQWGAFVHKLRAL